MKSIFFRAFFLTIGLLLFWQAAVSYWNIQPYLLPSPIQVISTLYLQSALIAAQAVPTIFETLLGFALGIIFGCIAGSIITFFKPLSFWFLPVLIISQAIPTFAIAPLLVIWLGYGLTSKVVTTMLIIFFPIASALYDGLCRTQQGWLDLAKTMNANKWRVFCCIRFPAALPSLASGIRIAAVAAPLGALVGEWVGSSQGLGYLMLNANARMQIDVMFAVLLVIIVLALALYFSVDKLLQIFVPWQQDTNEGTF